MKKKFWIVNKVNAFTAEVLMYGFIGEYEAIDDAAFITDLRTLEQTYSTINIRVNCGGGDVYKGLAIFNAIKNSKSDIKGFVDGIAASMGAVICAAIKPGNLQMSKYSRYMTHRVTGFTGGNADEMRAYADELDQLENIISAIISERTGLTVEEAKSKYITNKDRWISADQALQEKIIDGIYDAEPVAVPDNETNQQLIYNAYNKAFNSYSLNNNNMKEVALQLGLLENASEADIKAAVKKLQEAKQEAENKITEAAKARAKALITNAINAKKITESERAEYELNALNNYEFTEKALNKIYPTRKITEMINRKDNTATAFVDDEIDTWEKLIGRGDEFVAEFKKNNKLDYENLLLAYTNKPVELKP
ncbi:MAG: ATP-dependent Clp protease proteolytic subunit [Bacteroidetes bacterium]|nr:ATP-dependent Clp protease proteolytic subunit [Bacteroidota bacterium]